MCRHVFNHTNNWRAQLVEHIDAFACIQQSDVLGRRDNNGPVKIGFLRQCHLNVARARWQVYDQDIQCAPLHLSEHLLQRTHQHRAAPDNSLIFVCHEAQRHHRHAKVTHG